jgi:hypothetical protein
VTLTYPPEETDDAAVKPVPPPPAPAPDAPAVAVSVTDARPEPRNQVGSVRNAFGMKMASITTTGSVPAWVKGALETELWMAGVRVVEKAEGASQLAAQVDKVETDAYFTYGATVVLMVRLESPNLPPYFELVTGEGGAGTNWTATEASYSRGLSMALRDAARKIAAGTKKMLTTPAPAPPVPTAPPSS